MSEHVTSIERTDGQSRYGRIRRQYTATCSCGWRSGWSPVVKASAEEHAAEHRDDSTEAIDALDALPPADGAR